MDANPGPTGNPPPGTSSGVGRFFAGLVGVGVLLSPLSWTDPDTPPHGPDPQVCQTWEEMHDETLDGCHP